MKDFLKIKTVFENDSKRTIEELSKRYAEKKQLQKVISGLVYDSLLKGDFLKGKKILLKPNWVRHSIHPNDDLCLRTNDCFLLSFLELLLQSSPQSILIGDAPIQGCKWDKMLSEAFLTKIRSLSERYHIPVLVKDFRRVAFDPVTKRLTKGINPLYDYFIFDLGGQSDLEPISSNDNKFRVTYYHPDRMSESHSMGVHKYCISKEVFNADVIISMPKIKTHQKTGITGALKNMVGINGDKDYLPHHRIGGSKQGGDCYPGNNYLRLWSEKITDVANRNLEKPQYWFWQKLSIALWKLSNPKLVHQRAAGWYGNDTCWRMVMDLNKICVYGTADGKIANQPQRVIYSLCDGIIGGQGNGPLFPTPLPLGVVTFSNNSAIADLAAVLLMGFDVNKIALLKNAGEAIQLKTSDIRLNDKRIDLCELKSLAIDTIPPPGWLGYLK